MNVEQGMKRLAECRRSIDDIDIRILALLNERTLVVQEIGRVKRAFGMPIYEPKREDEVFQNVTANNPGPLSGDALRRVFERIIDEMRGVQRDRMTEGKQ
jgi:chorismate mutase